MIRMSTTASADFICSKCKKGYAWYADFAGKVARCTCGAVIQFPFTDPKPKDPLAIPFLPRNIEEEIGKNGPAPMELPREDLDPRILAERRRLGEYYEDAPVPIDPVRDVHGPFALLAIGLLLLSWLIADFVEVRGWGFVAIVFIIGSIVELGACLLGVMMAGKLMGLYFGNTKTTLFKLTSLYVAPGAIGLMIQTHMGDDAIGYVLGLGSSFLLYWGLFTFMFRIKAWQTLVCVVCMVLARFAVFLAMGALLVMMFGRATR